MASKVEKITRYLDSLAREDPIEGSRDHFLRAKVQASPRGLSATRSEELSDWQHTNLFELLQMGSHQGSGEGHGRSPSNRDSRGEPIYRHRSQLLGTLARNMHRREGSQELSPTIFNFGVQRKSNTPRRLTLQ